MINFDNLQKMIDDGFISVQKHPVEDLFIYNYTQKCQFAHEWNNETMQCRGLILDGDKNVIARPFQKFFNYEEHIGEDSLLPSLPVEDFEVFDKLDGSLGILYWIGDEPYIATRGSFTSDQAGVGTELFKNQLCVTDKNLFDKSLTYLFEIIYPANRIVVDYGQTYSLFLLAIIDTQTGEELSIESFRGYMPVVKKFDGVEDFTKVRDIQRDNAEGFVIRFKSGVRTKIKYAEYVRLHRLVTGVNAKTIWELLKNGDNFKDLLDRVPDEFFDWVETTKRNILDEFNLAESVALRDFEIVRKLPTRKDQAIKIMEIDSQRQKKLSGIVFNMLDGQDYAELIWRMIRPRADKPWKEDQE